MPGKKKQQQNDRARMSKDEREMLGMFFAGAKEPAARKLDAKQARERARKHQKPAPSPTRQRARGSLPKGFTVQCSGTEDHPCTKILYPRGRPDPGYRLPVPPTSHGLCAECERRENKKKAQKRGISLAEFERRQARSDAEDARERAERLARYAADDERRKREGRH